MLSSKYFFPCFLDQFLGTLSKGQENFIYCYFFHSLYQVQYSSFYWEDLGKPRWEQRTTDSTLQITLAVYANLGHIPLVY